MVQCKICGFQTKDRNSMYEHYKRAIQMHKMIRTFGKFPDSIIVNGKEYLAIEVIEV